jgi:hypothetical protein
MLILDLHPTSTRSPPCAVPGRLLLRGGFAGARSHRLRGAVLLRGRLDRGADGVHGRVRYILIYQLTTCYRQEMLENVRYHLAFHQFTCIVLHSYCSVFSHFRRYFFDELTSACGVCAAGYNCSVLVRAINRFAATSGRFKQMHSFAFWFLLVYTSRDASF